MNEVFVDDLMSKHCKRKHSRDNTFYFNWRPLPAIGDLYLQ